MFEDRKILDIAKGLGIIAVVAGHTTFPLTAELYMFHLALFIFISGLLFKDSHMTNLGNLFISRIKRLYVPFVVYNIIFILLHNFFISIGFYTTRESETNMFSTTYYSLESGVRLIIDTMLLKNIEQLAAAHWYFILLLSVILLFVLARRFSMIFKGKVSIIVLSLSISCLYAIGFWLNKKALFIDFFLDVALVLLPVFLVGFLVRKYNIKIKFNLLIAVISAVVVYWLSQHYTHVELSARYYINWYVFLIASFTGIYFVMYLSTVLVKIKYINSILSYIGQKSALIMCTHIISFKLVNWIFIKTHDVPDYYLAKLPFIDGSGNWWTVYVFVGVTVPLLVDYLVKTTINLIKGTKTKKKILIQAEQ